MTCYVINMQTVYVQSLFISEYETTLKLNAVKINIIRTKNVYLPGEWIRVLPRYPGPVSSISTVQ